MHWRGTNQKGIPRVETHNMVSSTVIVNDGATREYTVKAAEGDIHSVRSMSAERQQGKLTSDVGEKMACEITSNE
jgi:hypothetical protein